MKAVIITLLTLTSLNALALNHRLNFQEPVSLKKIQMKPAKKMNFISLYREVPAEKKLISKF